MTGRIPDETLQAIRDRVSLVEVVSTHVALRKAGRNYLGLCPFHSEKTPSFTVSEERGLFHCFGCGAGGTVFTFLMKMERLDFPEAVEQLAKRAGVKLPERTVSGPAQALRERLYGLNEQAARFFAECLNGAAGANARSYLARRGLTKETIERVGLGYAPPNGSVLATWLARRKLPLELALQLGLIGRSGDGRTYDKFRARIMFPIRDARGRVIAFGGRSLGDEQPKYLNSPESAIFRKGDTLYGLCEAREAIREADRAVLVEGYMDALMLVQEGVPYAVATLGTALTVSQLRLLRRFSTNVIAFFDGDDAGRNAATRAFALCIEAGVWGRAAFLPQDFDPDSYVRQHGAEATIELLDQAVPLFDFYLQRVARPGASLPEQARAAQEVSRVLARASDPFERDLLVRRAAAYLGVSEEVLRGGARIAPAPKPPRASEGDRAWPRAELMLLQAMALEPRVSSLVKERGTLALFTNGELAGAGQRLVDATQEGRSAAQVMDSVPEPVASHLTQALLESGPFAGADPMQIAQDCVAHLERQAERRVRGSVTEELRRAERNGDEKKLKTNLESLSEMLRRVEGGH
jgi:DNA primase